MAAQTPCAARLEVANLLPRVHARRMDFRLLVANLPITIERIRVRGVPTNHCRSAYKETTKVPMPASGPARKLAVGSRCLQNREPRCFAGLSVSRAIPARHSYGEYDMRTSKLRMSAVASALAVALGGCSTTTWSDMMSRMNGGNTSTSGTTQMSSSSSSAAAAKLECSSSSSSGSSSARCNVKRSRQRGRQRIRHEQLERRVDDTGLRFGHDHHREQRHDRPEFDTGRGNRYERRNECAQSLRAESAEPRIERDHHHLRQRHRRTELDVGRGDEHDRRIECAQRLCAESGNERRVGLEHDPSEPEFEHVGERGAKRNDAATRPSRPPREHA